MERTTWADVEYSFREWLALTGSRPAKSNTDVGGFRLGHDGFGRPRIEQIITKSGAISVVGSGLEKRSFVDAVFFLDQSKKVAKHLGRKVAKRRSVPSASLGSIR